MIRVLCSVTQPDGLQTRPSPVRSLSLGRCVVMLGIGLMWWSILMSGLAAAQQLQISHKAMQQIQTLVDEKAARTEDALSAPQEVLDTGRPTGGLPCPPR